MAMTTLEELRRAIVEGDHRSTDGLVRRALEDGVPAASIFAGTLIPAMDEVGQKMRANEYFIPEVLMSAKAMKAAVAALEPLLADREGPSSYGTVVLGTVAGDLHDIGKNLVALMLRGAGLNVVDLGTNVSAQRFVAAVREHHADLLGMSALLTTTMLQMKEVIAELEVAGLRPQVRVMIGGAPVTQRFADEIGVDGAGLDAAGAVELARSWLALQEEARG